MTLGTITQQVRPIFVDRNGREHIGEAVPFGLVADSQGYTTWGMCVIGYVVVEG